MVPWIEKYRPKFLDDIILPENTKKSFKSSIKNRNLPHLLFYGPPGTGKTSAALAIAKELFGDLFLSRVMELNASDERGINVIRGKIKKFATFSVAKSASGHFLPSYKLIILDEADNMTPEAQHAMRRIIESYSKVTRFCLICNYISRIIEPIASRCAKFLFRPLPETILGKKIIDIGISENIKIHVDAKKTLSKISRGDFRKAIIILQTIASFERPLVTKKMINEIADFVPKNYIESLWQVCQLGAFEKTEKLIKCLMAEGYSIMHVINQLFKTILKESKLRDVEIAKISSLVGLADKAIIDGSNEYLQLLNLSTNISMILKKSITKLDEVICNLS